MQSPKERLEEIREEIESLNNEALDIVKTELTRFDVERSKSYWHAYIDNAVCGSTMLCPCPMQEMIDKLEDVENEKYVDDLIDSGETIENIIAQIDTNRYGDSPRKCV